MNNLEKIFKIKFFVFLSIYSLFFSHVYAYELPKNSKTSDHDTAILKKMSEGIASLAQEGKKGLVYISVSKDPSKNSSGAIDPFEFFFGQRMPQMQPPKQEGLGSGFLVDLKEGYILTNNHVIEGADEISVKLANGSKYDAKIVGKDSNTDIAIIEIINKKYNKKNLVQLNLGNSEKLNVGSFVVALGAPFKLEASITFGVVSAKGRGSLQITEFGDFIQTDAAINPGNSGGPLIDMDGDVVGINTAIFSKSGAYNGIGFAIPSSLVRSIATRLINEGSITRGYLGVGFVPLKNNWPQTLNLPEGLNGVIVTEIRANGPAEKAGLKKWDIVVSVGNKKLENPSDLSSAIGLMKPGQKTNLEIYRDSKMISLAITIGAWPGTEKSSAKKSIKEQKSSQNDYGLVCETLENIDQETKDKYAISSKEGLFIVSVDKDSSAEAEGIRRGDLITMVNLKKDMLKTPKDLDQYLNTRKNIHKGKIVVGIERAGSVNFVELRPNEK